MNTNTKYRILDTYGAVPIKAWVDGLPVESAARLQLENISRLNFIYKHIAVMPDVHLGKGATVGSVIPTVDAIIPAAVGVDIGCGMVAVETTLKAKQLPDNLAKVRDAIERAVPHGRTNFAGNHLNGGWKTLPKAVESAWVNLDERFKLICDKHKKVSKSNSINHLGTLGGGNHFVEVCIDESDTVWFMLHSGSRGVGNAIGSYFIEIARIDMLRQDIRLPDSDLAYLQEGSQHFSDYVFAVEWAQDFARINREIMMANTIAAFRKVIKPGFQLTKKAVNCHHNYISKEVHFGEEVYVTRKGALRAKEGELGIIPGSMGTASYIVRGKGNSESFHSCSHGAGRRMSRSKAKQKFTVEQHKKATSHVECRKDRSVIDETPLAYKDIDKVIEAQSDLVDVLHTLKQVVCVKG